MLSEPEARRLLQPFGLALNSAQVGQVLTYLELLLRWNRRINLTSVRSPEDCMTRHFGESLFLATILKPPGPLLDIGSGAGFPALALKTAFPNLPMLLIEPVAKKRAFLKEVARTCGFEGVETLGERAEDFAARTPAGEFGTVTSRAVGKFGSLVSSAVRVLRSGGLVCLWVGKSQVGEIAASRAPVDWREPCPIPLSRERVILIGSSTSVAKPGGK